MNVYFISGLGADKQVFEYLKIDTQFSLHYIDWIVPIKNESILDYSQRMAASIDTTEDFILIGYSFGGIIAQEINRFLNPKKTILISTIKNRQELSSTLKWIAKTPLYKVVPVSFFTSNKILSYTFFRRLYDRKLPTLKKYFTQQDPYYLKWSIQQILNWQPKHKEIKNLYHIHGNKDIVFPIQYIKHAKIIEGGTHLLPIQKHEELSRLINYYLLK